MTDLIKALRKRGIRFVFGMILTLCAVQGGRVCRAEKEGLFPFGPGEKLVFEARWEFIKAGEAVLEILPLEEIDGVEALHFVMHVKTVPFVDVFYMVRDRMDSYVDASMTHALLYKKHQEGRRKREIVVTLDWEKGEARYTQSGQKRDPVHLMPGAFDPLSVFYAFRKNELEVGGEIRVPVTDGKKCILGKARVIRMERIRIKSGAYDTYLVEPDLEHLGGVFEKSKDAELQIWVSADTSRIPLRVKSRVAVGSFYAELIHVQGITPPAPRYVRSSPDRRGCCFRSPF
ncbi:MAG: DUF3108 domain-containing protein [Desulfatiglandales bacterium]